MKRYNLLPKNFKIIGLVIIVIAYVVPVTMGILHIMPQLSLWKLDLSKTGLLLGLLLIALTRENAEDEFVASCRFQAMGYAFAFSIALYISLAIISLLKIEVFSYSGFRALLIQLLMYLIKFHLSIRGMDSRHAQ